MTRIDFYILERSDNETGLQNFCCRLIEKALHQGNKVLVCTDSAEDSESLDDLLWSFKPESYLPHAIVSNDAGEDLDLPILITHKVVPKQYQDVMVNMRKAIPDEFARFARFVQLVNQAPTRLELSRRHFAFFRERGYPIEINKLNR